MEKFEEPLYRAGYGQYLKIFNGVSADTSHKIFDAKILPKAENLIVIKKELQEDIDWIKETIDSQRKNGGLVELPFLMFGHENEKGVVVIDKIDFDYDEFEKKVINNNKDWRKAAASFEGKLTNDLNKFICESKDAKPVVILGHTHPSTEKYYSNKLSNCFSYEDVAGCREVADSINNFNCQNKKDVQVANMVVNSAGDFNTIFCDSKNGGMLYKLPDIYIENEKSDFDQLPAFKGKSYIDDFIKKNDRNL